MTQWTLGKQTLGARILAFGIAWGMASLITAGLIFGGLYLWERQLFVFGIITLLTQIVTFFAFRDIAQDLTDRLKE